MEKFNSAIPPGYGTQILLRTTTSVALGTATTETNIGWDLKGDDGNSDLPTASRTAYLLISGVSDTEFNELDGIIDAGVGTNLAERQLRGHVKYRPASDQLYIYMQHQ